MDATTGNWYPVIHGATLVGIAVGSVMLTGACAAQPAAAPITFTIAVTGQHPEGDHQRHRDRHTTHG